MMYISKESLFMPLFLGARGYEDLNVFVSCECLGLVCEICTYFVLHIIYTIKYMLDQSKKQSSTISNKQNSLCF